MEKDKNKNNSSCNGTLLVITGPSGVGKDTVIVKFLEKNQSFHKLITDTSRPPRQGEVEGVDYNFFTYEEFLNRIGQDIYLEYTEVRPKEYKGMPKDAVKEVLKNGNVILKIDEYAAAHLKDIFRKGMPDVAEEIIKKTKIVYIAPQEWSQLREQYFYRESKAKQEWFMIKLERDKKMWMKYNDYYDYIVVNRREKIDDAVSDIEKIVLEKDKNRRIRGGDSELFKDLKYKAG